MIFEYKLSIRMNEMEDGCVSADDEYLFEKEHLKFVYLEFYLKENLLQKKLSLYTPNAGWESVNFIISSSLVSHCLCTKKGVCRIDSFILSRLSFIISCDFVGSKIKNKIVRHIHNLYIDQLFMYIIYNVKDIMTLIHLNDFFDSTD